MKPIPTPLLNTNSLFDYSDADTVFASNNQRTYNATSDNKTTAMQLSTDDEIISSCNEAGSINISTGICMQQYTLPCGGRSTNKTSSKEMEEKDGRESNQDGKEGR